MKHTFFKKIILFAILTIASVFVDPIFASAATIKTYIPQNNIGAKDVFVIDVIVDTQNASINTIEGSISLLTKNNIPIEVRDLSIAGSAFSLWPKKPSLSENGKSISFIAGAPGGLIGDDVHVFKIIVSVSKPTTLQFSGNIQSYLNDGKGTSLSVKTLFTSVDVNEQKQKPVDFWNLAISKDTVPPEPFEITLQEDSQLYDGKKFILFNTKDTESGIDFYEIIEDLNAPVRATDAYVIVNKDFKEIKVIAHDVAGNIRVETLSSKQSLPKILIVSLVVVLCFIVLKRKSIYKKLVSFVKRT